MPRHRKADLHARNLITFTGVVIEIKEDSGHYELATTKSGAAPMTMTTTNETTTPDYRIKDVHRRIRNILDQYPATGWT